MGEHRHNPHAKGTTIINMPTVARDAYGRSLQEGDEVIVAQFKIESPRMVVAGIAPNLHPQSPPNTIRIILTASITVVAPANGPAGELLRVLTKREREIILGKLEGVSLDQASAEASEELANPQAAADVAPPTGVTLE